MEDPNGRPVTEDEWGTFQGWLQRAPRRRYAVDWVAVACMALILIPVVWIVLAATR